MILSSIALLMCATISNVIWIILVAFRGGFWHSNQFLLPVISPLKNPPEIVVIIPARNEEMTIGHAINSLQRQNYGGKFSIIVTNDNSEDGTLTAAKIAAQGNDNLLIIDGINLPNGWTGKMWAIAQAVEVARKKFSGASYYLLTDADIFHHPENLSELVAKAQSGNLDLVSLMVKLRCNSTWENFLIPAFVFFFQKLYPFPWVNNPKKNYAGAAGGCMLVNCRALERAGGIAIIKNQIIDDCALAKLLKKFGPIWLGLSPSTVSLRGYDKLANIWLMVCRTAFVQLNYSNLKLLGVLMGMFFIYIVPLIAIFAGFLSLDITLLSLGLAASAMMVIAYTPTLRLYTRPAWESCLLPISALLYSVMTIDSARRYWAGTAPSWKGRVNIK